MLDNEISRRTLLKVIAAGCGVVVASSLPREWVKPVINAGVLPVHAQSTGVGSIIGTIYGCGSGDWAPSVGATVTLMVGPLPYLNTTTNASGEFTFTGVPSGTYDLHGDDGWSTYDYNDAVVTTGLTTDVGNIGAGGC
jgi:hypothetical protein